MAKFENKILRAFDSKPKKKQRAVKGFIKNLLIDTKTSKSLKTADNFHKMNSKNSLAEMVTKGNAAAMAKKLTDVKERRSLNRGETEDNIYLKAQAVREWTESSETSLENENKVAPIENLPKVSPMKMKSF